MLRPLTQNLLDLDNPDHARLRGLVHAAFTPRMVERLRERIQAVCNELLDNVAAGRRLDLISQYALPLPVTIIAELLGVPENDRSGFQRWSRAMVSVSAPADMLRALPAIWLFLRYIRRLVALRRAEPRDDLLTALVQAEQDGSRLSEDELLAMVCVLLIAGHETTVNLIGSGALALLQHPDQLDRLRAEPALIRPAVEELLRFTSPVELATERYAREDLELGGQRIARGDLVLAVLGSANRDERQFAQPDALDLAREPNRHLTFGHGAHYCAGAPLARMEGQIAIQTLIDRLPHLRLASQRDQPRWRKGLFLRGLERLPLAFG